jgi:hypothetical protein
MRWLGRLSRGLVELVVGIPFAALLAWQALVIGVNDSLGACLLLCGLGLLSFFALLAIHELGHLLIASSFFSFSRDSPGSFPHGMDRPGAPRG